MVRPGSRPVTLSDGAESLPRLFRQPVTITSRKFAMQGGDLRVRGFVGAIKTFLTAALDIRSFCIGHGKAPASFKRQLSSYCRSTPCLRPEASIQMECAVCFEESKGRVRNERVARRAWPPSRLRSRSKKLTRRISPPGLKGDARARGGARCVARHAYP